ncbi:hypothetical protein LX36DRAFT_664065 [Colletotrichum falcatum]|nr:hypothetical protein LX36DRAFT_664065 [Colletotrichum falcatum]
MSQPGAVPRGRAMMEGGKKGGRRQEMAAGGAFEAQDGIDIRPLSSPRVEQVVEAEPGWHVWDSALLVVNGKEAPSTTERRYVMRLGKYLVLR